MSTELSKLNQSNDLNDLEKSIQNSKNLYDFMKTCKTYMI